MDIGEEAMPFHNSISFDFLDQDEETEKYSNDRNSSVSIALIDPASNRRPRYPLSANAFLDLNPTAIRCPRPPSAAAEVFLTAAATELLHNRQRRMRSLSCSRGSSPSPLSPIENFATPPSRSPPAFKGTTPTQTNVVGEDVLVMDGILVDAPCGVNRAVARPSSDSSGTPGSKILYKTEICRPWEDSGSCRYGHRCQFAHGKEELRPARHPKSKPEICKSFTMTGACTFGPKCRYSHSVVAKPAPKTTEMEIETIAAMPVIKTTEMEMEATAAVPAIKMTEIEKETIAAVPAIRTTEEEMETIEAMLSIKMTEMQIDTIAAAAPPPPTRMMTEAEEIITALLGGGDAEACINQVLYRPTLGRRRLPVFVQICPQQLVKTRMI